MAMSNIIIPDTIVEEIELTVKTNSCAALHATPARIDTSLSEPIDPSASSSTRNSEGGSSPSGAAAGGQLLRESKAARIAVEANVILRFYAAGGAAAPYALAWPAAAIAM